jgi:pyruvate,orthophosphate dikinase
VHFQPLYVDKQIVSRDPFSCIDATGVGRLIEMAIDSSRKQRDDMKVRGYMK